MFDDIALFIRIVRCRGLSAAAEQLQLPPATVTRRLQKLEATLGCQLIHRSARQFKLTQEGQLYFDAYAELVQQMESTSKRLNDEQHGLSGRLNVLAPTNISLGLLQQAWSTFVNSYPDIQLDLRLNNTYEDVVSSGADIAIRIGPQPDSMLYQKRLGTINTIIVASPAYLSKMDKPKGLESLSNHRIIGIHHQTTWTLTNKETGQQIHLHPEYTTTVNDIRFASQLATDAGGIALLPVSEIKEELNSGALQQILTGWQGPPRDIFAVWPSGKLLNAKATCLRDFMQAYISKDPLLQGQNMSK